METESPAQKLHQDKDEGHEVMPSIGLVQSEMEAYYQIMQAFVQ